jgi:CxxC-x17-CxxC domain-containing protein
MDLQEKLIDCFDSGFQSERRLFPAICAQCGKDTQVLFEPKAGRPVYFHDYYITVKANR